MKEVSGLIIVDGETGEVLDGAIALAEQDAPPKGEGKIERLLRLKSGDKTKSNSPRGSMREITCAAPGCGNTKMVRLADIKRGWGKYCSKACAKK